MFNKLFLSHSYLLYIFHYSYELDGEIFMAQQQKQDTRFYVPKDRGNLEKSYFLFFVLNTLMMLQWGRDIHSCAKAQIHG